MACVREHTENIYFLDALNLFIETQWLYNTPVTDLLTKGLLDLFPKQWLNVLQTLENEELNDFVVRKITKPQWSETLKNFVNKCSCINRLPTMNTMLSTKLPKNLQIGLSLKKQHEIIHLTHLIHTQCAPQNIKIIVDLGTGLGYICQLLFHLYGYQVLGLEKNQAIVNNARNRQLKICLKSAINNNNFDIGFFLRQPFLRLACQEPADRWCNMSIKTHNEHSFYVLARAVLQLYAAKNGFFLKKRNRKGTRKSQCLNFETYVRDSLHRYILQPSKGDKVEEQDVQSNLDMHEKNIMQLWKVHCNKLKIVEMYTGLQLMLQAPAESFILQDRLCWMAEQGLEAKIIPVMNKRLSPRAYAIVSRKRQ
ncbi:Uncharacterized protein C12orf26 [Habropoda laboriosa]|uniref:Uncharacterized protein C12orf26 n=1 Tax=Habropoda laboriosa TaxID=597456 RepID=A0A0L7R4W4_9HYME|nr:Uncharacterized protein C12orf26 [Habropoda laboriosa]